LQTPTVSGSSKFVRKKLLNNGNSTLSAWISPAEALSTISRL
jgi:hypothetical protein